VAKRRAIPVSPHFSAIARPSSSTWIARAILPLPSRTPALRNTRAYRAPFSATSMNAIAAETIDSILGGALTIVQPSGGYRFAVDSILLGHFARPRPYARVLELGAGCGVVAVMLAALHRVNTLVAIELQPELAAMIERNATLNGTAAVRAICADFRYRLVPGAEPGTFDYVVANPPYRAPATGCESPNLQRRIARGAGGAALAEFIAAAARYATDHGKVAVVFTTSRAAELMVEMKRHALEPKRMRFVHPRAERPATLILVEARKNGGTEALIEPPLFLYRESGVYTDEAYALLTKLGALRCTPTKQT
jgi:tRNA1Val (adenine37-N6)-methyltransferase